MWGVDYGEQRVNVTIDDSAFSEIIFTDSPDLRGMLQGVKVLSVEVFLAGPITTRWLQDLGAEVIKIERPDKGDPYRHHKHTYDTDMPDDLTHRFMQYNRGKKSLPLDLKSDEGKEIFKELAKDSDVIYENLRSGKMAELGLGYDTIKEINEDIVYCSLSGYGDSSPYKDRPALNGIIQAFSGLIDQNSPGTVEPRLISPRPFADIVSGMFGLTSILAALSSTDDASRGTYIDLAMLDSLVSLFNHEAAEYSATGSAPPHEVMGASVPKGVFETSDSALFLQIRPESWETFCEIVSTDLLERRFASPTARQKNRNVIEEEVSRAMASETTDYWAERFLEADLLFSPVRSVDETFDDENLERRGLFHRSSDDVRGSFLELGFPANFSEYTASFKRTPRFGEHTEELLLEAGYSEDDIDTLSRDDVITVWDE